MDGVTRGSKKPSSQIWSHSKALGWEETDVPRAKGDGSGQHLSFVVIIDVHTGNRAGRLAEGIKSCTRSKSLTGHDMLILRCDPQGPFSWKLIFQGKQNYQS